MNKTNKNYYPLLGLIIMIGGGIIMWSLAIKGFYCLLNH